ncbi:glycoside hydrolase family 3 protein [Planomonospora venezuelensis]|uniref:Beta-N-acetylhexosaminidase n=1 Tax=Planomonospora venezuelensis TaxID=1999 RepID=A0A841DED2_PLAVE|nr:glycoside hydrolase family 3 N-terminal domain-containing protein [Planomonospora venezuelensis]MBB5965646.1 beta-N-acetylhexosaminidase [Planomonospora venezuelensis]GIN02489.1 hydrolase [Planomonospora venezuelensis]
MKRSPELLRLADSVVLPGFVGKTPPDWLRGRLADGLAGVVLFSRNIASPSQVAELTAALRAENPAVLVGIDEESGEVTRLEAATGSTRPGSYALGVVDDAGLTEEIARDLGRDLARAGVTLDFAPSADVNSNPDNPVIGLRSFGADPGLVARHTAAWIRGLQSAGVAACAKHFPGHGDTAVDSHHGLPLVAATAGELHEVALRPFRAAVDAGVRMVMTGHLLVPAHDAELPATLSGRILYDLLRVEMGFEGVIVTDGIEMAAVSGPYGIGGASALAVAGGADAVCVGGENADEQTALAVRDAIADAVTEGRLPEERLADAARRVAGLAAWSASAEAPPAVPGRPGDVPVGLAAARRALRVTRRSAAAVLPLPAPPHVVELAPEMNLAIDKGTPWGVGEPLGKLLPGTTVTRLEASTATGSAIEAVLASAAGRPLVAVVRDAHRHAWQADALGHLLAARPDAVVVEMGLPGRSDLGAVHLATHGSARVCGQAAAELLAGELQA